LTSVVEYPDPEPSPYATTQMPDTGAPELSVTVPEIDIPWTREMSYADPTCPAVTTTGVAPDCDADPNWVAS